MQRFESPHIIEALQRKRKEERAFRKKLVESGVLSFSKVYKNSKHFVVEVHGKPVAIFHKDSKNKQQVIDSVVLTLKAIKE